MFLYNYLTKKIEEFEASSATVSLYTCGPTVYDYVHIGNWRTFVFEDILKRALIFNGYKVKHIMNITDIDDKIINKAEKEKISISDSTKKYSSFFFLDLEKLNILKADEYPAATGHIKEMIELIQRLISAGFAYEKEGSVYFSVGKFKEYGKLSGANVSGIKAGARVDADEYDKENPQDFALWKAESAKAKKTGAGFDSPWGTGRPGWHIECSAMSMHCLGETIDIHCGGVDLLFPHHENEIAQSEAATGKQFVRFWMEGEHLLVDGEKMAKRLSNIFTLEDVARKGFDPLALRYLYLTAHYRSQLNFTWKSLKAAQNALDNLRVEAASWDGAKIGCAEFEAKFKEAVDNDLDMPKALSVMWEMVRSGQPGSAKRKSIEFMDQVLGLGLGKVAKAALPKGAQELIEKREELRKKGEFEESDKLREELAKIGVQLEDTPQGPKWRIVK